MDDRRSEVRRNGGDEFPPRRVSRYGDEDDTVQRKSYPPPTVHKKRRRAKKGAKSSKAAGRRTSSVASKEARSTEYAGGRRFSIADQNGKMSEPALHEPYEHLSTNSSSSTNGTRFTEYEGGRRLSIADQNGNTSESDLHEPYEHLSHSSSSANGNVPRVPRARRRSSLADKDAKMDEPSLHEPEETELNTSRQNSTTELYNSLAPPARPPSLNGETGATHVRYRDKVHKHDDEISRGSSTNLSRYSSSGHLSIGHVTPPEDPEGNSRQEDPDYDVDPEHYCAAPGAVSVSVSEGEVVGLHARNKGHLTLLNDPTDRPIDEQTFISAATRPGAYQLREHQMESADLQYLRREEEFLDEQSTVDNSLATKPPLYRTTCFKIVVAVVITAAIVVGVTYAVSGSGSSPEQEEVVAVEGEMRRETARAVVSLISDTKLLDEKGTPQNLAFEWIVNEDKVSRLGVEVLGDGLKKLTQRYVLGVFYFATGGESQWASTRNWLGSSQDECSWKYIICNADGEVTTIDTGNSGNRITGTIPGELGVLTSIHSILLRGNSISDLSGELSSLTNLANLRLDKNSFAGSIPSVIYQLTSLEALFLGENELAGTISPSISNLSKLTNLNMFINRLSGSIPSYSLPSVKYLMLGANKLKGNVDEILPNMIDLVDVDLSNNQFEGSIPSEVGTLLNLDSLILDFCSLTSTIPSEVGLLTGLRTLAMIANELTGTIPIEMNNLSSLEILQLSLNDVTGELPDRICQLRPPGGNLDILVLDCDDIVCPCCTTCN